ncbi:MAG: alpha-glucosidase [Stygiobacter sp. RIFOXYC2_FULL_38_25]|nr:MAG: alpha-glucosidase [Stygiobacter sp. RIFOXYB2_FULL_37_11]OGV10258.1 MAG: alpha-glucosidase [Stygiobacter sp. RIFOXYA2_FULL_38_8]OGV14033.1 MAG: alpha-glucosidase [Stygiobacter sp. RIFOXYC2_FULL_38_25]OGV82364.1 MAG: alpha-glucosidase [Stygiobacter sp. GWF2_38_21]
MKHIIQSLIFFFLMATLSTFSQTISSPNGALKLQFEILKDGTPAYELNYKNSKVIKTSRLGLLLKDSPSLQSGFVISKIDSLKMDETWDPVWGEVKTIRDTHNELKVTLTQKETDKQIVLAFRLFDEGLGFRYEFPSQKNLSYFIVSDELTQFNLGEDHTAFWIPGDFDSNEHVYSRTPLSQIDGTIGVNVNEITAKRIIGKNYVQSPLMMKSKNGLYINIFEAALVDYPAMHLEIDQKNFILKSCLVPDAVGNKAYMQTPCKTPWRTILVSDKATDILASKMILNLNEPPKIKNTDWIKPMKYVGIWWGMHVGTESWNYADGGNIKLKDFDWSSLKPNGKHGATTENTKRYIDFAAQHGFDGVLIEGWNVGWEDWFGQWKEEVFDFVTPYPDFDVDELSKYAASKNVKLIMHHETSASATNYERRMDDAFAFMKKYNYPAVKTGYVGRIIPRGELHDGQWMVQHYVRVAEKLAENKLMLDAHEPVRPTGLHRTYPNWLACEAARGNEFNAWSIGNPPEHETILPFTRLLGGPMDYTPGIFQIKMNYYDKNKKEQVHTTLAKQLALYLTMYSPLQMAADLPENYEKHLDAFQFIKDVAVDWDDSKYLEAEPGDYLTVARKAKRTNNWFIGSITDENERTTTVQLNFLEKDKTYTATIYADAKDAHWEKNPMAYEIIKKKVTAKDKLEVKLAPGGGCAISIIE